MVKAAPIAVLIALACLAAARSPSHPCRPSRRAMDSPCLVRLATTRAPESTPAVGSAPAEAAGAPEAGPPAALATLASVAETPSDSEDALTAELVSLSRRLLQGDLTLARTTLAEIDLPSSSPHVRNLCILMLAFTEEPRAREALRAKALSPDDDRAALALEAVMEFRQLKPDCPDLDLETFWAHMLNDYQAALLAPGGDHWALGAQVMMNRREINLAPPAEGEEGGGGATIEEQAPSIEGSRREVLVAVAQAGASLAAREKAIAWLPEYPSTENVLRAMARSEGTPNRVKSAVYAKVHVSTDDYSFLKTEVQGSTDPQYLATLCGPLVRSAGERGEEALAILGGLARIADSNARLAEKMMWEFSEDNSVHVVEEIERIARSAESEDLRHAAVSALDRGLYGVQQTKRIEALQRLSWAPSAGLAAEASYSLLKWSRQEPAWATLVLDDAFLQRAGALAQMPAAPERLRLELCHALTERTKPTR